jgi:transcriptional regulator with XRE-family HTH domain
MALPEGAPSAGPLLREWRQRRNLSQLELALRSAVSARHLSFIETGRSRPSREMVLHLADRLDVPLRERNRLLMAAGFAPVFSERGFDEGEMAPIREALERFLVAHEPYPALVVDRHWNVLAANRGVAYVNRDVAPELRKPPANALRIALHPDGLASRISNLANWSGYLLARLRREIEATGDHELKALYEELVAYPGTTTEYDPAGPLNSTDVLFMQELRLDERELAFFCTLTTFGTPRDLTLAELSIIAFYPANRQTAEALSAAVSEAQTD